MGIARPLDPDAVKKTDDEFYANHPELIKNGKRQPLDAKDPTQAGLRQEWMTLYNENTNKRDQNESEINLSNPTITPCPQKGILVALVKTPSGEPIEDATVEVKNLGWTKRTDENGVAHFGEVIEGNYTIEASKDGYSPEKVSETQHVPGQTTVVVQLQLTKKACCKIEVRATELASLFGRSYYHLFIIFTDENGTEYYLRGGPNSQAGSGGLISGLSGGSSNASSQEASDSGSNPSDLSSGSSWGDIITEYGQYLPHTIDYDPQARRIQVDSCTKSCPKYQKLIGEMEKIENAHIHYNPLGPNSNSVVFTALRNIGITPSLPTGVWAPGYDIPIVY